MEVPLDRLGRGLDAGAGRRVGEYQIVTDHDLPIVGDMGCLPGDELQIIHHLSLYALLTIS